MAGWQSSPGTSLFIGSHPDDIEIGAAGTVCRLLSLGWDVWFCILTSESERNIAAIRKQEAITAAQLIGISAEKILFTDFPDGKLD